MRCWSFGIGAVMAVACACAAEAADAPLEPRPKTEVGFAGAANRLWSGAMVVEQCVTPKRRRLISLIQPKQRYGIEERHGEMVGEFLSPSPAPQLVATARSCAAAAGDAATTPALLAGGANGFVRFQTAFSACMARNDAAQAVGSMTLWIDNHCNW